MGRLYVIMGKSASGKDSAFAELMRRRDFAKLMEYTTRPIRTGEVDGEDYYFTSVAEFERLLAEGKVIEHRRFDSVIGPWYYFHLEDDRVNLSERDYLCITTLPAYKKLAGHYGKDSVVPIYLEVEDGTRLHRALAREDAEENPRYDELCRRYLADEKDFSEENLSRAGITEANRFRNDELEACVEQILGAIED